MKILFLIAQENFRDEEFFEPYQIFKEGGNDITIASIKAGECKGKLGRTASADIAIKDADISGYDALVIAGGPGAPALGDFPEVISAIRKASEEDKIIGAICIAPTLLAKAGVISGKKVTVWNGDSMQQKVIEDAGATYTKEDVVADGKQVTASGPASAKEFAEKIISM